MSHLLCFGAGYTARAFAKRMVSKGWRVTGTSRTPTGAEKFTGLCPSFHGVVFDGASTVDPNLRDALQTATHVVTSIGPGETGDPVLNGFADDICASRCLQWIGYLSTIGVYGDQQGAWVDETTVPSPGSARSKRRLKAENQWLELADKLALGAARDNNCPRVQVFRLAGIYGPGRSAFDKLRAGTARRLIKPGQVFNRIHVDDIATVLYSAASGVGHEAIYNVADDEPTPPQDAILYAAELMGVEPPPEIHFDEADLSPMARSFYSELKRVSNGRIKSDLGVALAYPTYREGFRAVWAAIAQQD